MGLDTIGGKIMGATSTTGTGPGESHGVPKPENSTGCGGAGPDEPEPTPEVKRGCVVKHKSGNVASASAGSGGTGVKVC
jgi:hypothetical protein